jgi:hypothetical protein
MGGYDPRKNIFEVTDSRGSKVICTEETWYAKILGARPYMSDWIEDVKKAIINPHYICRDTVKENRYVYYKLQKHGSDSYLKVVVKFDYSDKGIVITAYPTDSGKQGETIIWTRSSNS